MEEIYSKIIDRDGTPGRTEKFVNIEAHVSDDPLDVDWELIDNRGKKDLKTIAGSTAYRPVAGRAIIAWKSEESRKACIAEHKQDRNRQRRWHDVEDSIERMKGGSFPKFAHVYLHPSLTQVGDLMVIDGTRRMLAYLMFGLSEMPVVVFRAMTEQERRDYEDAYHEAGHAVVGHVLGGKIEDVRIRKNGLPDPVAHIDLGDGIPSLDTKEGKKWLAASTTSAWLKTADGERQLDTEIMVLMAGEVAVSIMQSQSPSPDIMGKPDWTRATSLLRSRYGYDLSVQDCVKSHRQRLWTEAESLVRYHWAAVKHVAVALVKHGVLSGSEATAIMDGNCTTAGE